MKSKRSTAPFPCRFDKQTTQRLQQFSAQTGISMAVLVRHGVKQALAEYEQENLISFAGLPR